MTTETKQVPTFEELKSQLMAALVSGNDAEVMRLTEAIRKNKTEVARVEAERIKAENEALAGERAKVAEKLTKHVARVQGMMTLLQGVKATGFSYKLPTVDQNGVETMYGVALMIPAVKEHQTGTGHVGSTGKLKDETGMSRGEMIAKYATDEEKAAIQTAFDGAESRKDSARYNAEKPVIKRILADHPELIKR